MNEYMKKLEVLEYMVENGYHLMNRTMDDYCRDFSLEDLERFCRVFMGEEEAII